jgi:5-methylcytosine-specific restriction endonuclease McrA
MVAYSNEKMNAYMKERWRKRRLSAIEFLGGHCVDCGTEDGLEFDHIDPKTKVCSIAKASSFSELRFWAEVEKCQLLCTPCHLEKSRSNGDFAKNKGL